MGTLRMPRQRDDAPYDEAYTLPARLNEAGVKFAMATSDDTAHERNLPYQGPPWPSPTASPWKPRPQVPITQWPAEILGVADDQVGSLGSGKAATLILTSSNPLEVTTHVEKAFIKTGATSTSPTNKPSSPTSTANATARWASSKNPKTQAPTPTSNSDKRRSESPLPESIIRASS